MIIVLILLFTVPARAYTTSQHISVAVLLADYTETNTQAFVAGFISHALLDSVRPQMYRFDLFKPRGNYDIVALETGLSLYQIWKHRENEKIMYAIAGSLAPDLIEGVFVIADKSRWYKGNHIFLWHSNNTDNRMNKEYTMIFSLTLFSFSF